MRNRYYQTIKHADLLKQYFKETVWMGLQIFWKTHIRQIKFIDFDKIVQKFCKNETWSFHWFIILIQVSVTNISGSDEQTDIYFQSISMFFFPHIFNIFCIWFILSKYKGVLIFSIVHICSKSYCAKVFLIFSVRTVINKNFNSYWQSPSVDKELECLAMTF